MKVIAGGRRTGRTTELIKMAAEAEARGEVSYIVCQSQSEAHRIFEQAAKIELTIGFPITIDEFVAGRYHNTQKLFIDNAEYLLQRMAKVPIEAISVTVG